MSTKTPLPEPIAERLMHGVVIPAHPLALDASRKLDERRQRALTRYYCAAGAGGVAVGVHTTQFEIRESQYGLFEPVLALAAEEVSAYEQRTPDRKLIRVAGVVGRTDQAVREAELARGLGYHLCLVSLSAFREDTNASMVEHLRAVGEVLPVFGFYLQPSVGGRWLDHAFWRAAMELENLRAIKVAPFNRYATLDVVRAVAESGRAADLALYTGNDDNIFNDLLMRYQFGETEVRFQGGLLGQWAVWTHRAVQDLEIIREVREDRRPVSPDLLTRGLQLTDANAVLFDAANGFAGCIPGIHEVLRRQGLLEDLWTLNPDEVLSPGQREEIDRIYATYPEIHDDAFVAEHLDEWLS